MKITTKSHYGVQVMSGLAQAWGQGPVSLVKIAYDEKLPHDYLEQLMISLRRHGLVRAQRGTRGGYLLSRSPAKINLREIIQALEGDLAPVSCVAEDGKIICPSESFCQSKKVWRKVQESFLKSLEEINLKEVCND